MKLSYSAKKYLLRHFIYDYLSTAIVLQALIIYWFWLSRSPFIEFYEFKLISAYSLTLIVSLIMSALRLPEHYKFWKKNLDITDKTNEHDMLARLKTAQDALEKDQNYNAVRGVIADGSN